MNFVEELRWRGMLHDMMPGTEELLAKEQVSVADTSRWRSSAVPRA